MNFLTFAVIDEKNLDINRLNFKLDRILEKYDQNLEINPEIEPCYCIGRTAIEECSSKTYTSKYFNEGLQYTYKDRKDAFYILLKEMLIANPNITDAEIEKIWTVGMVDYNEDVKKELRQHNLFGRPDPACQECGGQGQVKDYINKLAKWNTFDIGGRYSGILWPQEDVIHVSDYLKLGRDDLEPYAVVSKEFWVDDKTNNPNWRHLVNDYLLKFKDYGTLVILDCHL